MIHPTAIIAPGAQLDSSVEVGPYSIIDADVEIGAHTRIGPHVVIKGGTRIGEHNHIYQFCSIGEDPQDKKYVDEKTQLIIGDHNNIREFCTFNRGTSQGGGVTRLGDHNWIMAYVHLAHDCIVGNHTIFANNAGLAGHVVVDDWAILGGFSIVHQHCHIGAHSFLSFGSRIDRSVPPYVVSGVEKTHARGINAEGLKRRDFSDAQIVAIRRAYKLLYRSKRPLPEIINDLEVMAETNTDIRLLVDFLAQTERSFIH